MNSYRNVIASTVCSALLAYGCGRGSASDATASPSPAGDGGDGTAAAFDSTSDDGMADNREPLPDGSYYTDSGRVDPMPDVAFDTLPTIPPKDALPETAGDSAPIVIPDAPPPACGPTCKAPSACTTGCNRCDCYAEPNWVCTAKACPGEGTGPCPKNLPLPGPICGGKGTCVYDSQCSGGKDIAQCDGMNWIVTKAPCP